MALSNKEGVLGEDKSPEGGVDERRMSKGMSQKGAGNTHELAERDKRFDVAEARKHLDHQR